MCYTYFEIRENAVQKLFHKSGPPARDGETTMKIDRLKDGLVFLKGDIRGEF